MYMRVRTILFQFRFLTYAWGLVAALLVAEPCAVAGAPSGHEVRYFRVATGTSSGVYFSIGSRIANAITNPPGTRPCVGDEGCGIPGLIVLVQATSGGVENLELLRANSVDAAMIQADLAAAAYHGTSPSGIRQPFSELCTLGTLYLEKVQVVVPASSRIQRIPDLRGARVSVGEKGSAIALDARVILGGMGLSERQFSPIFMRPGASVDQFVAGTIDALFIMGGAPFGAIADAASRMPIRLLSISAPDAVGLRTRFPLLEATSIPAGVYPGVPEVSTVGVGAMVVVRSDLPDALAHDITRALWQPSTRAALATGFPPGAFLGIERAQDDSAVPLHPGARLYYDQAAASGPLADPALNIGVSKAPPEPPHASRP